MIRGLSGQVQASVVANLPQEVLRQLPGDCRVFRGARIWPPPRTARSGGTRKTLRWCCHFLGTTLRLVWLILRHNIDLVHANNGVKSNPCAVLASRLCGRPCVCHLRGTQRPLPESRWLHRFVDHYIAIAPDVKLYYQRLKVLHDKPTSIVFNGVDVENVYRRTASYRRNRQSAKRVASFGRIIRERGFEYFVATAQEVLRRNTDTEFVIHGPIPPPDDALSGAYFHELRRLVASLGLKGKVRFAGRYTDVARVMSQTDVALCHCPTSNFGRIFFEAMACGVPLVAFDGPAVAQVAKSGYNCLLVPNLDIRAMAEAVLQVLHDQALANHLRANALATAKELFDYRENAQRIFRIYSDLLHAHGLSPRTAPALL